MAAPSSLPCSALLLSTAALLACSAQPKTAQHADATSQVVLELRGQQLSINGRPLSDEPRTLQQALYAFAPGSSVVLQLRGHVGNDEQRLRRVLREVAHGPTPRITVQLQELQIQLLSRLYWAPDAADLNAFAHGKSIELHVRGRGPDPAFGRKLEPLLPGDEASEAAARDAIGAACATGHCKAALSLDDDWPVVATLNAWRRVLGDVPTTLTIRTRHDDLAHVPPPVVQHTVRDYFATFRRCYVSGLGRDPNLRGDVVVRFIIQPDGKVSQAENDDGNMPDDYVVACVLRAFRALSFPQAEGAPLTIEYPIAFTPTR
ncbi:MAG TPA: AgmX/PglI C-terminal domain-containing protein [Polyangiaceae bacterium]|nr:AgmX/PglI C-terminal domain-containing protein [Polyangiaceae bacterium]